MSFSCHERLSEQIRVERYSNGTIKNSVPIDQAGRPNGTYVSFTESGDTSETFEYQHGRLHGISRKLSPSGLLKGLTSYSAGVKYPFQMLFHDNGQFSSIGTFQSDVKDGRFWGFREDGSLEYLVEFRNGLRQGKSVRYFSNGGIEMEGRFENDNQTGAFYEYFEDFSLRTFQVYISGCLNPPCIIYERTFGKNGEQLTLWSVYESFGPKSNVQTHIKAFESSNPEVRKRLEKWK
jgi:antitoxin component YwqK of YwqJK toxin-antitoxin module